MKILTGEQMARWDALTVKKHKVPALKLMERAAAGACDVLLRWPRWVNQAKVLIACGPGNNGGDGLAMAGMLAARGVPVQAYLFGDPENLSQEGRYFFRKAAALTRVVTSARHKKGFASAVTEADVLVDALFGTGLRRAVTGIHAVAVSLMNRARGLRFAVDMPTGISATTGDVLGKAFRADMTVTFECPKTGQLMEPGWDYVGKLEIVSIGLKASDLKRFGSLDEYLTQEEIKKNFHRRKFGINKGQSGKVLVVAGSSSMPGAGYLTSLAAFKAGAGLVTWALPEEAFHRLDLGHPEVILDPLPSENGRFHPKGLKELWKAAPRFDAAALGPGWGRGDEVLGFLRGLLDKVKIPKVIDADALNRLSEAPALLKKLKGSVLTPHPKEMSRLIKRTTAGILKNRIEIARTFAVKHKIWLVLKGYRSVIAGPQGDIYINSTGGPNLATAGSGDVLTGIIASLLAQGFSPLNAVTSGVFLHGAAGDRIAARSGDRGTLASEIAAAVPEIIREWTQ